jgi:type IV fimbrial biogenesis protein FimT
MGILAALAGPSFTPLIERWRVRQAVENMTSTIYYARSEAIKRGGNITVLKNTLTAECPQANTTQEWSCGWMVFVDSNDDGALQNTEETLRTIPVPSGVNVMNRSNSGQARFKVDRWGQINSLGAQGFTFAPVGPGVSSPSTTTLCVSSGGRIDAKKGEATC